MLARTVDGETVTDIPDDERQRGAADDGWAIRDTHKIAFTESGRALYVFHVRTLSDYEYPGTFDVEGDTLVFGREGKFSCSHPNEDNTTTASLYSQFRRDGDELWLSVKGFGAAYGSPNLASEPLDPAVEATTFMVFHPVADYETWRRDPVDIRCYAERSDDGTCHPACSGESVLD